MTFAGKYAGKQYMFVLHYVKFIAGEFAGERHTILQPPVMDADW